MATKAVTATILVFATSAVADPVVPRFERLPAPDHIYAGGWEHFVGGGVASFDCNGDSFPDLYVAGGANPAQLMINQSGKAFEAKTPDALDIAGVTGAYPLDVDSDGIIDVGREQNVGRERKIIDNKGSRRGSWKQKMEALKGQS